MNALREINLDMDVASKLVDRIEFKYKPKKEVNFE